MYYGEIFNILLLSLLLFDMEKYISNCIKLLALLQISSVYSDLPQHNSIYIFYQLISPSLFK
jgi:hypothetical protein